MSIRQVLPVKGVSFTNDKGENIQNIIKKLCQQGHLKHVALVESTHNQEKCIKIFATDKNNVFHIGYLPKNEVKTCILYNGMQFCPVVYRGGQQGRLGLRIEVETNA